MIIILIAVLLLVQLWVVINGLLLPRIKALPEAARVRSSEQPRVSVLIPMRNEARNVKGCIQSCKGLRYNNLHFVIIDDNSEDDTRELLVREIDGDPRFQIIDGKPLPEGWVGKVHACQQLSQQANGAFLLFLDADVRVGPWLIVESLRHMHPHVGLLSGFPRFPLKSMLGYLIVPLQHVIVFMHLPVVLANYTTWPAASAANGAFMLFRREAYEDIGGHAAVKDSLVEDVHIARQIKTRGWLAKLSNPTASVICLMYANNVEVWEGFSKNIFPGLGRNPVFVAVLTLFYAIFFVAPLPVALYGLLQGQLLLVAPLLLTWTIKFSIDIMTRHQWWLCFLMPVSMFILILLMNYSMYLVFFRRGFTWKGRHYK